MDTHLTLSKIALEALDARAALQELPLALVLANANGEAGWANARCEALFDPASLPMETLLRVAQEPNPVADLEGRNGAKTRVRVSCVESAGLRMLVLDDTPGAVDAAQLAYLGERIAQLEREVMVDPLTAAWNRRYFDRALPTEIVRSRRYKQPLSVAMLDLDLFKKVNDERGHAAGDAVLWDLVRILTANVRMADTVCRWGGEEFVVILPYTDYAKAAGLCERLRAAVEAHVFPGTIHVTASIGVVEVDAGETTATFCARMDAALYEAKEAGRNRVVCDPRGASAAWANESKRGIMSLDWHESYASGHGGIDAEHRELFRLANELIAASLGEDRAPLKAALQRCFAHIEFHFEHEEGILAQAGYAKLAQHRQLHRELLDRAAALRARLEAGESLVGALVEFLAYEVVARHILRADKDFFPLVAASTAR